MPVPYSEVLTTFQARFHRRWNHLNDPHVRALAWLLDGPDLLDAQAPQWRGLIATLDCAAGRETWDWLTLLEREPAALHAYLGLGPYTRLGRYAEKLMAFYFQHQGTLLAHGLQVRASKMDTVGEFDFLLRRGEALLHWEFATKFYLLEAQGGGMEADYFIGPNLADTLGAKMRKILDRQLSLAHHPAAQIHLPQSVASAQALVKGWLFYHDDDPRAASMLGLSDAHCRGFWCALDELDSALVQYQVILPRLSWLAPAKVGTDQALGRDAMRHALTLHFQHDTMPVLIALLEPHGDCMLESKRGFVVPDDWRNRAEQRVRQGYATEPVVPRN